VTVNGKAATSLTGKLFASQMVAYLLTVKT
jgi:hypothetical protein